MSTDETLAFLLRHKDSQRQWLRFFEVFRRDATALGDQARRPHHRSFGLVVVLEPSDEVRLTEWMHRHLRLNWFTAAQPKPLEARLITALQPPLNIDGAVPGPVFDMVTRARAVFLRGTEPSGSVGFENCWLPSEPGGHRDRSLPSDSTIQSCAHSSPEGCSGSYLEAPQQVC